MTGPEKNETRAGKAHREPGKEPASGAQGSLRTLQRLPGLAAISVYMFVLAGINILGVVSGQARPALLIFSAVFITAALGLPMLLRWAWALTLAAMALLVALFLWKFSVGHDFPYAVQGLLNLVFFFYLVRTEVREKLR